MKESNPNFVEALLGLMLEPSRTSEALLQTEEPPFSFSILVCLILSIFVPILAQLLRYNMTVYDPEALISLFVVLTFSLFLFVLLEGLFLALCQVDVEIRHLFAIVSYSAAPVLLCIWLIYAFNYFSTGNLSFLQFLVTGYINSDDRFLRIIPLALLIAHLNVLVVFFYGIRTVGKMQNVTALVATFLSLIPFYVALIAAMNIGEAIRPGTIENFLQILKAPSALTEYKL